MGLVRRHVDALRGIGHRNLLVVQRRRLLPQVAQVLLEPVNPLLALERLAMARNDVDEIDRLQT